MSVTRIMFVTLVTSITLVMLKNSLLNQRVKLAGVTFVASVALCNVCYAGGGAETEGITGATKNSSLVYLRASGPPPF